MNERKSSLSQQTSAIFVANFLGISCCTFKPRAHPPPQQIRGGALNESNMNCALTLFYFFLAGATSLLLPPGAHSPSYATAHMQSVVQQSSFMFIDADPSACSCSTHIPDSGQRNREAGESLP